MLSHKLQRQPQPKPTFADIIGHVEVDFVALREEGKVWLWAVDLNICASSSLSNFQLFDFLAAGQLDAASGTYWIPSMAGMLEPAAHHDAATQQQYVSTRESLSQPGAAVVHEQAQQAQHAQQHMPRQASSQLADAEVQAALQQSQTERVVASSQAAAYQHLGASAPTFSEEDTSVQMTMSESTTEPALQQDAASRPITGESGGDMTDDYAQHESGGYVHDSGHMTSMAQSHAVVMENDSQVWQATSQSNADEEVQLEPRYYTAIDILFHSGMSKQRSTQFLQNCRLAHLGFDMMGRQGLVLNFMDNMSSGCVGVQCSASSPQAALQGLANVSLTSMISKPGCKSVCLAALVTLQLLSVQSVA